MKKLMVSLMAVFAVVFSLFILGCGQDTQALAADRYKARVLRIHDGDTVTVKDEKMVRHKLRLYAIDAPELAQRGGDGSFKNLQRILPVNQEVVVEVENIDRYKREVATIYFRGENINRRQIAEGHAWHYIKYDKKFVWEYSSAENKARKNRWGLWRDEHPQAPWEWRAAKRQGK